MPKEILNPRRRLPFIVTNLVILVASIALLAACSRDGTATQQPIPTATPTVAATQIHPTPTPTQVPPTPMPTQTPPAPTPTQTPVTIEDLDITDSTTVREIMAALSDGEVDCVRDAIGASTFDALQGMALSDVVSGTEGFPLECLTPEKAIDMSIAFMSAEAGGLSADTRNCIRDAAIVNPGVLGAGDPGIDTAGGLIASIQTHLCLSNEEYAAIASGTDAELPPPSVLKCLVEQLGGLESLAESFSAEVDDDVALVLFSAAMNCEETSTVGGIQGSGN